MCRCNYPPSREYLNHAEKSDATVVKAFKRMQVIEDEEQIDAADEDGEPDEEVLNVHFSSCPQVIFYYVH
jgi:coatomer subunit beta'